MSADVSEEHVAFIFRVEEADQETNVKQVANSGGLLLGLFFDPENKGDMFLRNVG
jgi:hypothetical protein